MQVSVRVDQLKPSHESRCLSACELFIDEFVDAAHDVDRFKTLDRVVHTESVSDRSQTVGTL